jgi:hypothetical protein
MGSKPHSVNKSLSNHRREPIAPVNINSSFLRTRKVKNKMITICLVVFVFNPVVMAETIYWDDGLYHIISDSTYQYDTFWLDYNIANDPGTYLKLSGGVIDDILLYNSSSLLFKGGIITKAIRTNGTSTVTMIDGSVGWDLHAYGSNIINIMGGSIGDDLFARGNSIVTLSGGSIGNYIVALDNSVMYLNSSDLRIDSQILYPGDSLRNYGVPGGTQDMYLTGTIMGTLQDGSPINNTFFILEATDADIIVILEPTIHWIITFIHESVAVGDLEGLGAAPDKKIESLIKMLDSAGELIATEDFDKACKKLEIVLKKCDSQDPPPDFVTGTETEELAEKITELMEYIGCE